MTANGAPDLLGALAEVFAKREQDRQAEAASTYQAMNPRERRLVREAAVMGYVRGHMAGRVWERQRPGDYDGKPIPPDAAVVLEVVSACLSMPDLYPVMARMQRVAERRVAAAPGAAPGGAA